jgi:hypothetical protein
MTMTMIAHIGKPLERGAAGALLGGGLGTGAAGAVLAAELAALVALEAVDVAVWAAAAPKTRRFGFLARSTPKPAKPREQAGCAERPRHVGGKGGGDRAFLTVEHSDDRRGVGPVRWVLLADHADHHLRDGADHGLRGALWSARVLAQRAREAGEAPAAEDAVQEIGALGQDLGVAAGEGRAELGQKIGVGVGDRVGHLLGAAGRRRRRA